MPIAEYRSGAHWIRDHAIEVPLDHDGASTETITVFARDIVRVEDRAKDLPLLLFLQGGPGGEGPRPLGGGWWATATETHRVVLLDQRGTGRSSPIDAAALTARGDATAQADFLALFRGDAIVRDAEALRRQVYGGRPWATLGQSYGGFLTLIYLSTFPEALTACHITGGLASIEADAAAVYRATFPRQAWLNERFHRDHPHDARIIATIRDLLAERPITLPTGDVLDVPRLQALGMGFGMSTGVEQLHWLLDTAVTPRGEIADRFVHDALAATAFASNPLYAALQECIYQQGHGASRWAAQAELARHPEFAPDAERLYFTGEMIFPWMFERIAALRPFRAAVELLHERAEWPRLYDPQRLAANEVPVAAIQYYDDPYVETGLAMTNRTAVGNLDVWVTSEFLHDGLRMSADKILPRLFLMTAGR